MLFLHANSEDYLADSLLHGLRLVLGDEVVDVPRRDALYDDLPAERRAALYGRGFTLYGRLPEPPGIARDRWLERVFAGEFGLVVVGDVHRNWAPWVTLRRELGRLRALGVRVAVVDGGDGPVLYPFGPTWWRHALPRPLPRALGLDGVTVFKRELQPLTAIVARRRLARRVRPIGFSIPEDRLARGDEPRTKLLSTHVVDPEVVALVPGAALKYAFASEDDYYADLRSSRFAVTTKKAGWETLRHYENAASGAIPCFRDLHRKPAAAAPFGLSDGVNCVAYSDPRALLARLEAMPPAEEERLRAGALAWAARNTTRVRALELLDAAGHPAGARPDRTLARS